MKRNSFLVKLTFSSLLLLIISGCSTLSWSGSRQVLSTETTKDGLLVETTDGSVFLRPINNNCVEVAYEDPGNTNPVSESLIDLDGAVYFETKETASVVQLKTESLTVEIQKKTFQVRFLKNNQTVIAEEQGFFGDEVYKGFRFRLDENEKIMGGGERVLGMDRRGHRLELNNKPSYGYETEAELMYYSMPVVVSSKKYMLIFDNGARGFMDIGATEEDILQFEASGGRMSYYVVVGDDWVDLAEQYTSVTGTQPLPPRWTLGNIASRMGYHTREEVESVVQQYKEDDIPLDSIVMDLFWFGPDIQGHMGNLDWDTQAFPKPEEMIQNLKDDGIKMVLITEPFILNTSSKWEECVELDLLGQTESGEPYVYDFYFGTTGLLDVFKPETRDWFWNIYKRHTLTGIAGWWGDLGEPEVHPSDLFHVNGSADEVHNIYGHQWAKLIQDGYAKDFENERPVILMRSGFVGSQRYGMVPWTGDVNRTWGGLKPQVEISLQMGLQGLAYMHSDLGGFAGDYQDSELYTRWLQYGVFQPIYRTHAQEVVPAEPIYWDEETKSRARDAIKLRYALTPYNYTTFWQNSVSGIPMMRPLFYVEDREDLIENTSEYLWGDAFLVAPVVDKGIESMEVYFPTGSSWIDLQSGEVFGGGQTVDISLNMESIPVFVKAGSFVPMISEISNLDAYGSADLEVHFYFEESLSSSEGVMYEDDGQTRAAFEKGEYVKYDFSYEKTSNEQMTLHLQVSGSGYKGLPENREITWVLHGLEEAPNNASNSAGQSIKYQWVSEVKELRVPQTISGDALKLNVKF